MRRTRNLLLARELPERFVVGNGLAVTSMMEKRAEILGALPLGS
jgi:hypothetical protein